MNIKFFGATREVTGSCYLVQVNNKNILVECGMFQGSHEHEKHNHDPFPFEVSELDAVIVSHAHLDHTGRLPLLIKEGFHGAIYTHNATVDLCKIMLIDSGYIHEKEARWENKKRERKGLSLVEPLYTTAEAETTCQYFKGLSYDKALEICEGAELTLRDAGHIIGSAILELTLVENGISKKIVFSGDLGHKNAPILRDPFIVKHADLVIMESTYGDRLHRKWDDTWQEMGEIIAKAKSSKGNILIPAFTVGRTQELLYEFKQHFDEWQLGDWQIFLDSPMGIKATTVYAKHHEVYDAQAEDIKQKDEGLFNLPNLHMSEKTEYSMKINQISSGAIIIAGSGMCTGGRIKHHFKHNIWRESTHVIIVGFQAKGTLGRSLVDGCEYIKLWGEKVQVKATIHTIGGFSAHADQQGLLDWYQGFENKPPVVLVHGEVEAMDTFAQKLKHQHQVNVTQASYKQNIII
ncbi:MAG: MBL fold metallo-hydrolase [Colwellia sp.]|jgi:metallo-beta-lactamase family protein|uniref:MBL fold metallo-hydrolase RNA specificity domain-containing protein n=1 Tax=Colwellia sp. Bg11-12 TaxID=2759817 RepID=UPI0015F4771A|nr:MBL fold metallo-hydrolase [Colwellia sp. Bg11-12]MBA6265310.1 MBL fold metallo-hydrolase [Colwellia sp. Bg11-12]